MRILAPSVLFQGAPAYHPPTLTCQAHDLERSTQDTCFSTSHYKHVVPGERMLKLNKRMVFKRKMHRILYDYGGSHAPTLLPLVLLTFLLLSRRAPAPASPRFWIGKNSLNSGGSSSSEYKRSEK